MNYSRMKTKAKSRLMSSFLTSSLLFAPGLMSAQQQTVVPPLSMKSGMSQKTTVDKLNSEASLQKKMETLRPERPFDEDSADDRAKKSKNNGIQIKKEEATADGSSSSALNSESFRETVKRLRKESPDSFGTPQGAGRLSKQYFDSTLPTNGNSGKSGLEAKTKRASRSRALFEGLVPSQKTDETSALNPNKEGRSAGFPIKRSGVKKRGTKINTEVPSVKHVVMAPATKSNGGDDIEIVISPIYDVLIQMPLDIEFFRVSSASLLTAVTVNTNPNMLALKVSGEIVNPTPISLHVIDVNQQIYTFTIIGVPTDLSFEYPKTIVVTKRRNHKTKLGQSNPQSVLSAMDVDDAIQIVVGDLPRTNEYEFEFVSAKYMHHKGYLMYGFRMFRKDRKDMIASDLKFTIWANNEKLDKGKQHSSSRDVEWVIEPTLSARETRRRGYQVSRVFVQVRASVLTLEEWRTAFITASDESGYTRFSFPPFIRPFRAPLREIYDNESQ